MKIHQLPMGARFEYEGEEYVKSGPLFATSKSGQRLIPKYADLRPLDRVAEAPAAKPVTVSRSAVVDAFDAFYAQCSVLVPEERRSALAAARDGFLNTLGR